MALTLVPSNTFIMCLQRRAGAKGFGLFSPEDLKAGQFIIEYIGEVSFLFKHIHAAFSTQDDHVSRVPEQTVATCHDAMCAAVSQSVQGFLPLKHHSKA